MRGLAFRFTLGQLMMAVALIGIVLALSGSEWHPKYWQRVTSVAFSADGQIAIVGGISARSKESRPYDFNIHQTVTLVDTAGTVAPIVLDDFKDRSSGHSLTFSSPFQFADLSADGKQAVVGTVDGTVTAWDIARRARTSRLSGSLHWIKCAVFSPDGNTIAIAGSPFIEGDARQIILWRPSLGQQRSFKVSGQDEDARALAFSPDGAFLYVGGRYGVTVWGTTALKLVNHFDAGTNRADFAGATLTLSPDGTRVAAVGMNSVCIWNANAGTRESAFPISSKERALAFAPDGKHLVLANEGGIRMVDATTGATVSPAAARGPYWTDCLAVSEQTRTALTGDWNGDATLWDLNTLKPLRTFAVVRYQTGIAAEIPLILLCAWCSTALIQWRNRVRPSAQGTASE